MTTPIYDFVKKYSEHRSVRFHMPGHKGQEIIGCEKFDITEISGADVLYSADGIILESENNLSKIYDTEHSFYSTEGSTLAIKAMLRLVSCRSEGERPLVVAARNVHASFVRAAALLDLDVEFIYPDKPCHLCRCDISADDVDAAIASADRKPCAVYLTTPDYLGNMLDIASISQVCRENGIPLLVDNAHGAYLKFLRNDMHPIALGAAMCADSAHKTLPVLTGGAYLHISKDYPEFVENAREALSLFASTSPSYLTLSSLDLCNERLCGDYPAKIREMTEKVDNVKRKIVNLGFDVCSSEPLKIVIKGAVGLADRLREDGIEAEFADSDFTVLMLTPENEDSDIDRLLSSLSTFKHAEYNTTDFVLKPGERVMTIRSAVLSPCEIIRSDMAEGRICASPTVSCPPAVPIIVSGEIITKENVEMLKHYGVSTVSVVKQI